MTSTRQLLTNRIAEPSDAATGSLLRPVESCRWFGCSQCGQYFRTMRDLNTHLTKKHGPRKKPAKPRAGDLMQHAVDGMPQCRHCSAKFTRFEALQKHILGGCPSLFPDNAGCGQAAEEQTVEPLEAEGPSRVGEAKGSSPTVPCATDEPSQMPAPVPPTPQHVALFDDPAFRGQLQTAWRQAFSHERYKHSLRTYCVFCGQWLALKGPSVKQHMRLSHPDRWRLKSDAESCCSSAGFISSVPCHYCGQDFKARHTWSSFAITANNCTAVHRDQWNEPGACLLFGVSHHEGGELWLEDPSGRHFREHAATLVPGNLWPTSAMGVSFDSGRKLHATNPWTNGSRIMIIAYTVRRPHTLSPALAEYLLDLGFMLPGACYGHTA